MTAPLPERASAAGAAFPRRDRPWDAVVVGAGPAGATTALELGRRGLDVLLLDRQAFPRGKVCGACLSRGSVDVLRSAGLGDLPRALGAPRLSRLVLAGWRRRAEVALDGGHALSRAALDQALVDAAVERGVVFVDRAHARLGLAEGASRRLEVRRVGVPGDRGPVELEAGVVVAADGLGGPLLTGGAAGTSARGDPSVAPGAVPTDRPRPRRAPRSRIGLGAVLRAGVEGYGSGTIHMAVGPSGYVGLVRLEDGALNVAAALDPEALRGPCGPAEPVAALLDAAGLPVPDGLAAADWHGTPPLTWRPRRLGGDRVFRVGDAAGYVEPFTGEGMCWALGGARALAPIAASAAARWDVSLLRRWEHVHRRGIGRAQRLCKAAAWTLRRPALARLVLVALGVVPDLASPFVRVASAPPPPTLSPTP